MFLPNCTQNHTITYIYISEELIDLLHYSQSKNVQTYTYTHYSVHSPSGLFSDRLHQVSRLVILPTYPRLFISLQPLWYNFPVYPNPPCQLNGFKVKMLAINNKQPFKAKMLVILYAVVVNKCNLYWYCFRPGTTGELSPTQEMLPFGTREVQWA